MLTRTEAVDAIQRAMGNTEEAAWMTDWTRDLWETVDELYKRLPPALVHMIIFTHTPTGDEEESRYAITQ